MLMPVSSSSALRDGRRHLVSSEYRVGIPPVLKWAGGKSQLLDRLIPLVPQDYGKYIEPFVGGGALFFALMPRRAVIADSNPELIAFYEALRDNYEGVLKALRSWQTDERTFYSVREMDPSSLHPSERAARLHYLNRTCFNGLYRVNKRGQFNVPYGSYKNPRLGDEHLFRAASKALASATIICEDYRAVLRHYPRRGDFIFLDPPYIPLGGFADFKRYTKKQFRSNDHEELAGEIHRLQELGCHVILTNSNTPQTRKLYKGFDLNVVRSRRNISRDGGKRSGEDVIVNVQPAHAAQVLFPEVLSPQVSLYPSTRFMGSKEKLLSDIWKAASQLRGHRVLDLFAGSGVVSYMFKAQGMKVVSNDYMALSATLTKALVENNNVKLSSADVDFLTQGKATTRFVRDTFKGLYFSDADNLFIDLVRSRICELTDEGKRSIAMAALIRACMKKRARGIFTYIGSRYDDGRRDMRLTLREHFKHAARVINAAVFDNSQNNASLNEDALTVDVPADIVYVDPPYYSKLSDNDYVRRYHFVEGLARNWSGVELQRHTKTKKFKTYGSPFSTYEGAAEAFASIFKRYANSAIIVSYSSNSLPDKATMVSLMRRVKRAVEIVPVDHRYSFGNQGHKVGNANNKVSEYLFVAP